MSKKSISLGAVVDDYTGDYLRQGGSKINDNFDDIYSELGDESTLHPAGAWKSYVATAGSPAASLSPAFGSQYTLDSTLAPITANFPAVTSADYGRVIRLRDTFGTWSTNGITVVPEDAATTVNGVSSQFFDGDYSDLTFVYTFDDDWKYVPGIKLNTLASESSSAGIQVYTEIASAGQDVFTVPAGYNKDAVFVFRNGALLYYKEVSPNLDASSEFGSADISNNLVVLNGTNIKLRKAADLNDVITVKTFTESVAASATSYRRYSVVLRDQTFDAGAVSVSGQVISRPELNDDEANRTFTLEEMGGASTEEFNPNATQIYLNGDLLTQAGTADLVQGGSPAGDEEYELLQDGDSKWNQFILNSDTTGDPLLSEDVALQDGDILTIVYYNNELGSVLPWVGQDSIKSRGDEVWLNTELVISRTNKIGYIDTNTGDVDSSNVTAAPDQLSTTIRNLPELFDLFFSIGTVYENASNPANPADYMGLGTWLPYAEGCTSFGFDSTDSDFGGGSPTTAGTKQGAKTVSLLATNIPELALSKNVAVLYNDGSAGEVNISGCIPSPDDTSPSADVASITSEEVPVNEKPESGSPPVADPATSFSILPPYIVSYKWVRVQ